MDMKNKMRFLSPAMHPKERVAGEIKISRKVVRALRTMDNRDKKRKEKDKERFSHIDYVGAEITDRAWNRPCKNAMLIDGLVEPDFSDSLIEGMDKRDQIARLHELLRELPPIQKRRLIFRFFDQKSYAEIAKIENVCTSAIHKSIKEAKRYIMDNF